MSRAKIVIRLYADGITEGPEGPVGLSQFRRYDGSVEHAYLKQGLLPSAWVEEGIYLIEDHRDIGYAERHDAITDLHDEDHSKYRAVGYLRKFEAVMLGVTPRQRNLMLLMLFLALFALLGICAVYLWEYDWE